MMYHLDLYIQIGKRDSFLKRLTRHIYMKNPGNRTQRSFKIFYREIGDVYITLGSH